ncbi:TniB family NTP-binding protein [Aliiroseovarius crassostreae]|uniref:TniB family NTP-binding protein n=1 Tax=Aliiroseovarius crassostreae TaxID=154981 RepID=UPI0021FF1977|nr:TniB family NTP-binding protein [Aliiroseovarius crassostreae]UWP97797.1 TniB family NTP-binding protein [Aliiroseovarius crassostreae]
MAKSMRANSPAEIEKAIEKLSNNHVDTDREEQLQMVFERLFVGEGKLAAPRLFSNGLETRGIAVVGDPGSGKTELISKFFERHPLFDLQAGIETARCLHVTVPNPATIKSVGLELLKALGYPKTSDRRERWAIWDIVKHRLHSFGIQVLWIDEAHDLYASCSAREQDDLLKTLKSLMQGEHAVVVILSGTKPVADLLAVDRQVGRRFSQVNLPPISFTSDGESLSNLLSTYCERVGLIAEVNDDLIQSLIFAAHDQFGLAIEISIGAIEMALRSGHSSLTKRDFIEYWSLQEGCSFEANVFSTNQFVEPESGLQPKTGRTRTGKRSK